MENPDYVGVNYRYSDKHLSFENADYYDIYYDNHNHDLSLCIWSTSKPSSRISIIQAILNMTEVLSLEYDYNISIRNHITPFTDYNLERR